MSTGGRSLVCSLNASIKNALMTQLPLWPRAHTHQLINSPKKESCSSEPSIAASAGEEWLTGSPAGDPAFISWFRLFRTNSTFCIISSFQRERDRQLVKSQISVFCQWLGLFFAGTEERKTGCLWAQWGVFLLPCLSCTLGSGVRLWEVTQTFHWVRGLCILWF